MIVADVLKYLAGEINTLTLIMVVGLQVMSFTVYGFEAKPFQHVRRREKNAPAGDEGAYMRWPHLPSLN